jgi:peptidyl-prolyl cis-trans isomerase A (cyclophilin A)
MRMFLLMALGGCPKSGTGGADATPQIISPAPELPGVCVSPVPAAGPLRAAGGAWVSATAHMASGDLDAARAVLAMPDPHPAIQGARAVVDLLSEDGSLAWPALRDLTYAWPDDGCLRQAAAYAALRAGVIDSGIGLAHSARELSPTLVEAVVLDGLVATMSGDPEGAATTWRAALSLDPDHPVANAALAGWYLRRGDALLALPLLERAGRAGVDVSGLLPAAHYRAGNLAEYLQVTSAGGWPLGDNGALAGAEDPVAAFRDLLGVVEGKTLQAELQTSMGTMSCTLFWDKAPVTVANFVALARGTQPYLDPRTAKDGVGPYYDGTILHRVIPGFMIQMGDPTGTGSGDPGYRFADEIAPDLRFDQPGKLAMANGGPGTNGAQFFVTEVPTPHLDGMHTIFGQCDEAAIALVKTIGTVPRRPGDRPVQDVVLEAVVIEAR